MIERPSRWWKGGGGNTNIYYHWRYILLMQGILFGAPGTYDRGTPMSALGSVESLNHWNGYEYHTQQLITSPTLHRVPSKGTRDLSRYFNLKTLVMSLLTSACHGKMLASSITSTFCHRVHNLNYSCLLLFTAPLYILNRRIIDPDML